MVKYHNMSISLDGNKNTVFTTETGLVVAKGYARVVIGSRGPYVEFDDDHVVKKNCDIPDDQLWRLKHKYAYYVEYRTLDKACVKIYYQKRRVGYADYQVGKWYISLYDLFVESIRCLESLNDR